MAKALVILRHENSLDIVRDYLQSKSIIADCVALDPIELPERTGEALMHISKSISEGVDVIVLGTKVYDATPKDKTAPPEQLIEFLDLLISYGCMGTPLCLTHLSTMPSDLVAAILKTGLKAYWVENDNIKRDGMDNLGLLILAALGH